MAVDDLLDVPAAAGHVGCSVGTIRYRMRRVGLAPTLRMGTSLFFTKEDLDAHFGQFPIADDRRRWRRAGSHG